MRFRLVIVGRVQGVGFRAWALRRAWALGVRGWVRNRRDGSVEVEAEAAPEVLDLFRQQLAEGPPHAVVDEVREIEAGAEALGDSFEVR